MNDNLLFKLKNAPQKPGCYLWKNINNQVIYVGKANNLFKRCHQYFSKVNDYKTIKLVNQIFDVEFFVVSNENEALILENNLIKKYQPEFNILLKEANAYPYFVLTNDPNPQLKYTYFFHQIKGKYYGPFATSSFAKKNFKMLVDHIFPLRKCNKIPHKKCLYYDLGQCLGPCIHKIEPSQYEKIKKQINDFFNGKTKNILKILKAKELDASNSMQYEVANEFKKTIVALNELQKNQNIELAVNSNIDFLGYSTKDNFLSIGLFSYVKGRLLTKIQKIYEYYETSDQTINDWITHYYFKNFNKPKILYVPKNLVIKKNLSKLIGIKILKPAKGQKKKILNIFLENTSEYFKSNYALFERKKQIQKLAWNELQNFLHLDKLVTIIAFDVSNLFTNDKVAGMIMLENGNFLRNKYRKFILNSNLNSDYECFKYVIKKYLTKNANNLPNLLIVDGGKIQVNATLEIFKEFKIKPPTIIGLIKDANHMTNAILFKNKIFKLDKQSNLYKFLANIQNEIHNYTIRFFRKKHLKSTFK